MTRSQPIHGTKCVRSYFPLEVKTLGQIYESIRFNFGDWQVNKPIPGEFYTRRIHPLDSQMDGPAFRNLPLFIKVLTPARLYRSEAWRFNGIQYMDAQTEWEFGYWCEKYADHPTNWMNVAFLTTCYEFQSNKIIQPIQLSLF